MAAALRALGVVVILLGLGAGGVAAWQVATDVGFAEIAAAYERHPTHALFQADYVAAAARHYALLALVVASLLGGIVLGAILLGLGELLRRLPGR